MGPIMADKAATGFGALGNRHAVDVALVEAWLLRCVYGTAQGCSWEVLALSPAEKKHFQFKNARDGSSSRYPWCEVRRRENDSPRGQQGGGCGTKQRVLHDPGGLSVYGKIFGTRSAAVGIMLYSRGESLRQRRIQRLILV